MSHETTMRLIVFGFVAVLFLVGFAMGVDGGGGGRPPSQAPTMPQAPGDSSAPGTPFPGYRDSADGDSTAMPHSPGLPSTD